MKQISIIAKFGAAAVCALIGLMFFTGTVYADDKVDYSIGITPDKLNLELTAGATYSGEYKVFNHGLKAYDFQVFAVPYSKTSDPSVYENDFVTTTNFNKITGWVTFEQDSFHLEPNGELMIKFTINVPKDAAGGQYAALMNRIIDNDSAGISAVKQLGLLLYSTIPGELKYCGELVTTNIPFWQWQTPLVVSATIKNCGNVDFRPQVEYEVKSIFGNTLYSSLDSGTDSFLMPESEREIKSDWLTPKWENQPQFGIYTIEQHIKFLDISETKTQIVVLCPIWLIAIIILADSGLIAGLVLSQRAKKRKVSA